MGRHILVAIGSAIIGALLAFFLVPKPPAAGSCTVGNPNCVPVSVITVNEQPQIQGIGDVVVKGPATLFWEAVASGYTFPDNGIEFPSTGKPNPAPDGEFKCNVHPGSNGRVFTCVTKGTPGKYSYNVNLVGPAKLTLDPYVVNRP